MTSPAFATEMNSQIEQARLALERATVAEDHEGAELAAARLADLTEVTRRHGVDVHHVSTVVDGTTGEYLG